jgi:hypothetical protein
MQMSAKRHIFVLDVIYVTFLILSAFCVKVGRSGGEKVVLSTGFGGYLPIILLWLLFSYAAGRYIRTAEMRDRNRDAARSLGGAFFMRFMWTSGAYWSGAMVLGHVGMPQADYLLVIAVLSIVTFAAWNFLVWRALKAVLGTEVEGQ